MRVEKENRVSKKECTDKGKSGIKINVIGNRNEYEREKWKRNKKGINIDERKKI